MVAPSPYAQGLDANHANFVQLTPLTFLTRTAAVYPNRTSVVYGDLQFTWSQTFQRCRQLASALHDLGVGVGDTVAVMLPNIPAMVEAHFGIPMVGAVLNTINTRLDPDAVAFILQHGEAKVLLTDPEFSPVVSKALSFIQGTKPIVIDVMDPALTLGERLGTYDYESLIGSADTNFHWQGPASEWDAIALNYTSGTTGNPKGVVYHHRGAYLNATSNIVSWSMPEHVNYLWTLPMFHCNGWCFPWTIAANAGTNICLRKVDVNVIFDLIRKHRVSHFCGAPIVHSLLANAPESVRAGINHSVKGLIAGAAPPAAIIEGMEKIGFDITHVYGLTETYGPAAVCAKHDEWNSLPMAQRAELNARQGVRYHMQEDVTVLDPDTLLPVPADGQTIGEIMFRGNLVMKGYFKNPQATAECFAGGWFHTGDLAVLYPDGYVKIRDRSKDVIISGGENISSIEVEEVLYRHPAVAVAAVVAKPDDKWGEVPCAFIELKDGAQATEQDVIAFCKQSLAKFKVPKQVIFGAVPKTSTGKIQKFILRQQMKSASAMQ